MWIKLTVCGVTRLGYGDAQGKSGGDAMKERIGDALRNAAMRFGAALDLWHKGILHIEDDPEPEPSPPPAFTPEERAAALQAIQAVGTLKALKDLWLTLAPALRKELEQAKDAHKHAIEEADRNALGEQA